MKKENKKGSYADAVGFMASAKVFTKSVVLAFLKKQGKTVGGALATASVTMGAREQDSKRGKLGNCIGNLANTYWGVRGYLVPLKSKSESGEKQFRFHKCTKAEMEQRQKLADKRELPKSRAKVAKAADAKRTARLARKAKTEAKAAIKATAKLVKSAKAPKAAPKAPKVVKAKAPKAPAAVAQVKVAAPAPAVAAPAPAVAAPAPAVAEVKIAAPAETTLASTVS